jgi:hypothetical protein
MTGNEKEVVMRFYQCFITVDKFKGCKKFIIDLCYDGDRAELKIPYQEYIRGYNKLGKNSKMYTSGVVNENFLWSEVEVLAAYFSKYDNIQFSYKMLKYIRNTQIFPLSFIPTGGGRYLLPLHDKETIAELSFKVNMNFILERGQQGGFEAHHLSPKPLSGLPF